MEICPHTGQPLSFPPEFHGDYGRSDDGVFYFRKAQSLSYGPDYFLEDYVKQYGRSYEEDAPSLRALARRRLSLIQPSLLPGQRVLEIGCALGFFLDEARSLGYEVRGLEISDYAARYAREKLHLNVECAPFLDSKDARTYDVVAAFYVIEHFADQRAVFEKIRDLLKPGGLFLFALPSTNGPMFTCQPDEWMRTHPVDHFADYSPASLLRTAEHYGMRLIKALPSSFHPNRARGFWRMSGPFYPLFARHFAFGDTMEGVIQKNL